MREYNASTVPDLLAKHPADHPAIGAPGREWLTYGGLWSLAERTIDDLGRFGICRNDRVAIVLPNGPEMAASFIAIASGATTAPLNPAYTRDEHAFYLGDLKAKALVVQRGSDSPARAAAEALGIPIIELVPNGTGPAGDFRLVPERPQGRGTQEGGPVHAQDVALVLHTSGTTARPKIVPLRQIHINASACHIGETLALTPGDVCLNIMPLFHVHGLIAAVLSSLAAGAAVFCSPGFDAYRFFAWLDEARPTWYTAVPTMHQAILHRASRLAGGVKVSRLRFIRSSSSALPPQVMRELEGAFGVPVLESYGMTEASHQITSNPLPPHARHPGAVGLAAGPEIGIMDEAGRLLLPQQVGEVVIRGHNVIAGYENNPEANAKAFTDGWFRTGDQGYLDAQGYLRLTGRLKEIINRGGEKVSPIEVDTMLMDHPAVAQCLAFALPHPMLGEEVAAAIVLHEGASVRATELRHFAGERLAAFKVPRKIVFLRELPKGATGKLQRIGLAERLGLSA